MRARKDSTVFSKEEAQKAAEVMKAVAHPLRLQIVSLLCQRDERVNDLVDKLGAPQTTISQQLRILRMSGLVEVNRKEGVGRYTLSEPRLKELLRCVAGCHR